eukprot:237789_1
MLFLVAFLLGLANGQSASDCVYRQGGLELDLYAFKGKILFQETSTTQWTYSVCSNSLNCVHGSNSVQAMVEGHATGINECHYFGQLNTTTQPFYDIAVATWFFNYSNGEPCPDGSQINRTTTIAYTCNPDAEQPFFSDVYEYDQCNVYLEIQWEGACQPAPPPNEHCEFRYGFQSMNLSSIQGQTLSYTDANNLQWQFSPCSNGLQCTSSHGSELDVMSEIVDPEGKCIKFLGVWSGDVFPFYDRTIFGDDYWDFFWMDGEECSTGGPLENLNVRYYCAPNVVGAKIRSAGGVGPCAFRIEIDSQLACANFTENAAEKMQQLNQKLVSRLDPEEYHSEPSPIIL